MPPCRLTGAVRYGEAAGKPCAQSSERLGTRHWLGRAEFVVAHHPQLGVALRAMRANQNEDRRVFARLMYGVLNREGARFEAAAPAVDVQH